MELKFSSLQELTGVSRKRVFSSSDGYFIFDKFDCWLLLLVCHYLCVCTNWSRCWRSVRFVPAMPQTAALTLDMVLEPGIGFVNNGQKMAK